MASTRPVHKIRRLREKDISCIAKIMRDGRVFNDADRRNIVSSMREYFTDPDDERFLTFIYKIDKKIAGFISIGRELGDRTYEIIALSVSPKHQRLGVARRLMKRAEKEIRSRRARMIVISTSGAPSYAAARRLYRRMDFERVATITDFFEDGDNRLFYAKRLRAKKKSTIKKRRKRRIKKRSRSRRR